MNQFLLTQDKTDQYSRRELSFQPLRSSAESLSAEKYTLLQSHNGVYDEINLERVSKGKERTMVYVSSHFSHFHFDILLISVYFL